MEVPMSNKLQIDSLVIRHAEQRDRPGLRRLAQLDSARASAGPMLVAELDGELRAAISLDDGRVIADPFRPTADVVGLLELRAGHVRRVRSRDLRVVASTP